MSFFKTICEALIPIMLLLTVVLGLTKRVNIYNAFLEGAKESVKTVFNIFPPVVCIMLAIGMLRASGFFNGITDILNPLLTRINVPAEIIPLALLRPMSGSGGLAMLSDILNTYGADSKIGFMASIICGSTETTFYTVAVYFGSLGINDTRHTIKCALIADFVCISMGILMGNLMY